MKTLSNVLILVYIQFCTLSANINFDFEGDSPFGWSIESGSTITSTRTNSIRTNFNKQGEWFIGTAELENGAWDDKLTGTIKTETFVNTFNCAKFLIGGGSDLEKLYVAFIDASSDEELLKTTGQRKEYMDTVYWDIRKFKGKEVYIKIVDNSKDAWGHLNVDFFQAVSSNNDHKVPDDKNLSATQIKQLYNTSSYEYSGDELKTIGMPVGGIASSQLYVRGDGTFGFWWLANEGYHTSGRSKSFLPDIADMNHLYKSGYHHSNTATFKPQMPIKQSFAVWLDKAGKRAAKALNENYYTDIKFKGEYPIATITYPSSDEFPVEVVAETFSPFIPLDEKNSSLPSTIIQYTVKNHSDESVDVSIAGYLQNSVCKGLLKYNPDTFGYKLRNTISPVKELNGNKGMTILMSCEGDSMPIPFNRRNGNIAFTVFDNEINPNLPSGNIDSYNNEIDFVSHYSLSGTLLKINNEHFVEKPLNSDPQNELIGALCSEKISLKPFNVHNNEDETKVTFLLVWNFPNRYQDVTLQYMRFGKDYVHTTDEIPGNETDLPPDFSAYNVTNETPEEVIRGNMAYSWDHDKNGIQDDAMAITKYISENFDFLTNTTFKFKDTYYNNTTLPYWFVHRIGMPISNLATSLCQWWAPKKDAQGKNIEDTGRFWAWEGIGSCYGTCAHVWNYAQSLGRLFPELAKNIREKQDYNPDAGFVDDVQYSDLGGIYFRGDKTVRDFEFLPTIAMDGQAGTVLKAYREHTMSADNTFLDNNWGNIKLSIEYLLRQDSLDLYKDGLINAKQHHTWDANFYGANPFISALYLGALKAGQKMAIIENDNEFANVCLDIFKKCSTNVENKMFNGEYYIQNIYPQSNKEYPNYQVGDGCLSDQLFGQNFAHQIGLGYILNKENVKSTVNSIYKYNWAPDVTSHKALHPPQRPFAYNGEGGLFNCTWPLSYHYDHREKGAVKYKNEVWTGTEYQLASHLLYEGFITEGLSVVKAIHDRYNPLKRNPWNEIECGDHYARSMASWGCLIGISGFNYNGPAKKIGFSPKMNKDNFKCFYTSAESWGSLMQAYDGTVQKNSIKVEYGTLPIETLQFEILSDQEIKSVMIDNVPVSPECYSDNKSENVITIRTKKVVTSNIEVIITYIN